MNKFLFKIKSKIGRICFVCKEQILNGEYDFIFGIGAACSCTQTLRNCCLQFRSYPLDWLYGGDLKTRIDLLVNHFTDFINQEDLKKVDEKDYPLHRDIYCNLKNGIVFNHDFEFHQRLEDTYPAVKEKYDRRIKRLYEHIKSAQKILIVYMQSPDTTISIKKAEKQIKQNFFKITEKYPDKNIQLLYLVNKKYFLPIKFVRAITDNAVILATNYRHKDRTTADFVVNDEYLKTIFKNVKLNKKVIAEQIPKI